MPVFVSYSHSDTEFVDRLALELIRARKPVWIDRYEIRAGESLISRIQEAIGSAGAMLVVLSKASVESEWCKKELSSGLVRELEERRVLVIPLLIEDCTIPLFLRDKYYADFRINFEKGLRDVLEAIANVTNDTQGRLHTPEYLTDWAVNWSEDTGNLAVCVTVVEHHRSAPFSALTVINVECNDEATERYRRLAREGFDAFGRGVIFESLAEFAAQNELFLLLEDQTEKSLQFGIMDSKTDGRYSVNVTSRRLGEDTGKDILVNISAQLLTLRDATRAAVGKLPAEDTQKLLNILIQTRAG